MSLQLRMVLIVCLAFASLFAVAAAASRWTTWAQDARIGVRDQVAQQERTIEEVRQGLIREMQLRRSPAIASSVVASHVSARESHLEDLAEALPAGQAEPSLLAVLQARERLDEAPRADQGAATFAMADAQDQFVEVVRQHAQAEIERADLAVNLGSVLASGGVGASFIFSIVLTVVAMRRSVVGPLLTAEGVAIALQKGYRDVQIPVDAPGEAGRLLQALDALRAELAAADTQTMLHEAELVMARDEALRAAASRQRFLAAVSHELRTPLHGVIGVLDLLSDGEVSESDRALLAAAQASSRDLHELVEDILSYTSAADDGQASLEEVRGRDWLEDLVQRARPMAERKGISLAVVVPDAVDAEVLRIDSARLGRAVHHLVDNAVKFTTEGGVVVRMDREGDYLWVRVVDTGPGIPASVLAADGPFTMGDQGWTRANRGAGVGLGLVHALTHRLGGRLDVRSTAEGTEVGLCLPVQSHDGALRIGA